MRSKASIIALSLVLVSITPMCTMGAGQGDSRLFQGPINAVYRSPLVCIVPTQERTEDLNRGIHDFIKQLKQKLAKRSKTFRNMAIMTDRDALEADLSGKSLMVYGTPTGNLFLAKHVGKLPVSVKPDAITAGRRVEGNNLRLVTMWPNPQDASRGMIIYTAQRAEDIIGINRFFHGPEDFVIRGREVLHRGLYRKTDGPWQPVISLPVSAPSKDKPFPTRQLWVKGSPEQIGQQIGSSCGPALKLMLPVVLEQIQLQTKLSKEAVYAIAQKLATQIDARDIAEMQALAKAADMDYEDVLLVNVYYSLNPYSKYCRQIAVWGPAQTEGAMLHGRNLDWPDFRGMLLQRNNVILNVKPENGLEYLILTWPGLTCAITGTNREGLTLAANTIVPNSPKKRLAEPTFFTLKRVLRTCRNVEEAVKMIKSAKPFDDISVLISDAKDRSAVVVEIWGGNVRVRYPAAGEHLIGNANHPTTDACRIKAAIGPADEPMFTVARKLGLPLSLEQMKRVLSHPQVLAPSNIVSVVFEPSANRMFLSCGRTPAAKGQFIQYELFSPQNAPKE